MSDRPRHPAATRRRWPVAIAILVVVSLSIALWLSRGEAADARLAMSDVQTDSVVRGVFIHEVHGSGTLVPVDVRLVSMTTSGRVDEMLVTVGRTVTAASVLIRTSNPDVVVQAMQAEQLLRDASASATVLQMALDRELLAQEMAITVANSQRVRASHQLTEAESLASRRLMSSFEIEERRAAASEANARVRVAAAEFALLRRSSQRQRSDKDSILSTLRRVAAFQNARVASLNVTAGGDGVLQELTGGDGRPLSTGQWVNAGTTIARIIKPGGLTADVRLQESAASDVAVGMRASVSTRQGVVEGSIARIDPAVVNGTIGVSIAFSGRVPPGLVPAQTVEATIDVARTPGALVVARPVDARERTTGMVYRLTPDRRHALATRVRFGRASPTKIEILDGLHAGDRIIISDLAEAQGAKIIELRR